MGFEKKCECCGKKFETKRYPTKYCSQACYRKMHRTAVNKRKMKLMKQYDSSLDVICDDGTLRFRKVCDHCGKNMILSILRPSLMHVYSKVIGDFLSSSFFAASTTYLMKSLVSAYFPSRLKIFLRDSIV